MIFLFVHRKLVRKDSVGRLYTFVCRQLQGGSSTKGVRDNYEADDKIRAPTGFRIVPMYGEEFIGGNGRNNKSVQ